MSTSEDVLKIESDGPIRIMTLNRPEALNSFNAELNHAFISAWAPLVRDEEARAVVITGAGRAFSAGGDVPGFKNRVNEPFTRRANLIGAEYLVNEVLRCPLPIISAVNGPAVGLGASIMTMSDLVYMNEETFLADTHVPVGLTAGDGGAALWPHYVGMLRAKQYLLTGDRIPAAKAVEFGLATEAVPADQVLPKALEMANRLAELPKQAVQDTKRALNLHLRQSALSILPFSLASEDISFTTPEVREQAEKFEQKNQK